METQKTTYWQHKIKCLACGLHYIVCSDYEHWPNEGTTRDQVKGEATGVIICPECGVQNQCIHWTEEVEGFIFQAVPGLATTIELRS